MSGEWNLVAACCRPMLDPQRTDLIAKAAEAAFDPETLLALARRNRVEGFVQNGLTAAGVALPPEHAVALLADVTAIRLRNLHHATEEVRLAGLLKAAGIDAVFVKGSTTALLAHDTLSLKSSWDIDLLVAPDQAEGCFAVLLARGYVPRVPGQVADPRGLLRYISGSKEMLWMQPERMLHVEVHVALVGMPGYLEGVGVGSPRQSVRLSPGTDPVLTLATPHLLTYLAAHGTLHGWSRLKWLTDYAALASRSGAGAAEIVAVGRELGAGRTPAVALTLAARCLGFDLQDALGTPDRGTQRLIRLGERWMSDKQAESSDAGQELKEMALVQMGEYLVAAGPRHWWRVAWAQFGRPYRAWHIRVPHWLLRPLIAAWLPFRIAARPFRRSGSGG